MLDAKHERDNGLDFCGRQRGGRSGYGGRGHHRAAFAARTWRSGLHNQRLDKCLAAVFDLKDKLYALEAAIDAAGKPGAASGKIGLAIERAWESQTRFRTVLVVARRYKPVRLSSELPDKTGKIVEAMEEQATNYDSEVARGLLRNMEKIAEEVRAATSAR